MLYKEYVGAALQFLQNEHYKYTRLINAILAMTFLAGKKPLISRNIIKLQEIRHYFKVCREVFQKTANKVITSIKLIEHNSILPMNCRHTDVLKRVFASSAAAILANCSCFERLQPLIRSHESYH